MNAAWLVTWIGAALLVLAQTFNGGGPERGCLGSLIMALGGLLIVFGLGGILL